MMDVFGETYEKEAAALIFDWCSSFFVSEVSRQNLSEFKLKYISVVGGDCKDVSSLIGIDVIDVEFVIVVE